MARPRSHHQRNNAGAFFMATLVIWFISILFEIAFKKRKEVITVLFGCLFFQTANWIIRRLFVSGEDPLFVNTSVSLLHSTFISASVVFILLSGVRTKGLANMFEHSQLVNSTWPWAFEVLCFSCGYFAYDQLDMLLYGLYSGFIPSILVHHLILLICFTLALYRDVTINYLILTLICELHSVFLHVRKLRRMAGIRSAKTKMVKAEWLLNWTSFIFARLVPHLLIIIKLIRDAKRFDKGLELPLALFGMIGMNALNIGLGIDLLGAYRREKKPADNNDHNE